MRLSFWRAALLHSCKRLSCSSTMAWSNYIKHALSRWRRCRQSTFRRSRRSWWCFPGSLCTFRRRLHGVGSTWVAVAVAAVSLGVDADHVGHVGALDVGAVEQVLSDVVELVRQDPPLYSQRVICFLSHQPVSDLSEPPNAWVIFFLPFLCHWFLTAKNDKLISTRINNNIPIPKKSWTFVRVISL